ncbi:thiamine phosphate synthase [Hyphobacterium sp. HN65]|uniref:Thiamine phosphate synthase n=1 Tax=Hyphobacterium lacteum TaxID=3116575 RepID=A0ABU7LSU5_9PROT|nr:thiamine phosphate synthase [Hyphobacterium sp. HN65]MEE2526991.1 thiamine phosphate synthase [Hyphobacterium sp. HN65]
MTSRNYSEAERLARLAARWPGVPDLLPPLMALTDPVRTPDVAAFASGLPAGCALIYRHFGRKERFAEASQLAGIARAKALVLLISADPALAEACDADGVHWPARLARQARDWRRRNRERVMTVSAHDRAELERAHRLSADAALLSPVCVTNSRGSGKALGRFRSRQLVSQALLPVYALGGVNADSARRLEDVGFSGLAAIEALQA